jgi:hypothetical protein
MLKKYSILYGIIIPILLLVTTLYCQEISQHDKDSMGSGWKNNCQSNRLNKKAVNDSNNCIPVLGYFQDVVLMRQIRFTPF